MHLHLDMIGPAAPGPFAPEDIASITYRSRACSPFDRAALEALTRGAQQRNRALGLSGMLLYEDGRFFQSIEGPPDALEPVWDSIRHDPRHHDIELLSMRLGEQRMFGGWSMRWMRKGSKAGPGLDFLEPVAPSTRYAELAV